MEQIRFHVSFGEVQTEETNHSFVANVLGATCFCFFVPLCIDTTSHNQFNELS